jgi:hypothetical protein
MRLPVNKWVVIRIESKDKKVRSFINGKQVFSSQYPGKANWLKAISLKFNSFAKVDYVRLWNEKGELVENEDFN